MRINIPDDERLLSNSIRGRHPGGMKFRSDRTFTPAPLPVGEGLSAREP